MTTLKPHLEVLRREHFDVCSTIEIKTSDFYDHTQAEHSGLELCFCPRSEQHRHFRGKSWLLKGDQAMVFNARERHIEECSKNPAQHESFSIIIKTAYISKLLEELAIDAEELLFNKVLFKPTAEIKKIVNDLFLIRVTPEISYLAYDCLITDLLLKLLSQTEHSQSKKIFNAHFSGRYPSNFAKAKIIMRETIQEEDMNLEKLANLSGLSKFHFARTFKDHTGLSPIQYLNRLKVDFAKPKLLQPNFSITNVLGMMGYSDISTFNKSFRKICGISPSMYRKKEALPTRRAIFS